MKIRNPDKKLLFYSILNGFYIALGLFSLFLVMAIIVLLAFYVLKSWLGVDLFPEKHLADFFRK